MTEPTSTRRADLEKTVRALGGYWDTKRGLRALRDAGHAPQDKHTRAILRTLVTEGLLEKVEDRPIRYRLSDVG
ncbi:hypothetical protein STPH1_0833 [Streptomyces sp. OM5714]|nr:hypothetical protein STPH1_0833 [Streptomyces sp. OM5714]